jgi:hypothetical protein
MSALSVGFVQLRVSYAVQNFFQGKKRVGKHGGGWMGSGVSVEGGGRAWGDGCCICASSACLDTCAKHNGDLIFM